MAVTFKGRCRGKVVRVALKLVSQAGVGVGASAALKPIPPSLHIFWLPPFLSVFNKQ